MVKWLNLCSISQQWLLAQWQEWSRTLSGLVSMILCYFCPRKCALFGKGQNVQVSKRYSGFGKLSRTVWERNEIRSPCRGENAEKSGTSGFHKWLPFLKRAHHCSLRMNLLDRWDRPEWLAFTDLGALQCSSSNFWSPGEMTVGQVSWGVFVPLAWSSSETFFLSAVVFGLSENERTSC